MRRLLASAAVLLLSTAALAGCIGAEEVVGALATGDGPVGGFSSTSVFQGEFRQTELGFSRVLEDGALAILDPKIETLTSEFDGEPMPIGVYLPDVPEGTKVPVIAFASPYLFSGMTPEGMEKEYVHEMLVENYVPHGYAVAYVPVRGTSNHGGCMDLMGPAERADLNQAITWLGEQPWSNGAVGMVGASYDGSTPWQVASFGNPYLKTIVPVSGVNDWFTLMYHNGTTEWRGPILLNALYYSFGFVSYNPVENGREPLHVVNGVVCPESWEGLGMTMWSATTGARDPLGFWEERNSRPGVEANYRGSILMVQGLQDWNVDPHNAYPWTNHLESQGIVVKHMLGQWGHAFPDWGWDSEQQKPVHPRLDWAETLLHWFDYWLKGDTTRDLGPRAQVQDSSGQWRNEDAWPPRDAEVVEFYLAPGGALATEPSSDKGSEVVAIANPWDEGLPVSTCPACPTFATEPFESGFRFAGIPQVHVTVTPTAPSQEIAAWLYSVSGGERQLVGWGQIDTAYAAGGEDARPAVPGQPLKLHMVLEPLDAVVPPGGHLELVFHQWGYGDHAPGLPPVPMKIEVGGDQSVLRVHAIERDGSTFFTPPSDV